MLSPSLSRFFSAGFAKHWKLAALLALNLTLVLFLSVQPAEAVGEDPTCNACLEVEISNLTYHTGDNEWEGADVVHESTDVLHQSADLGGCFDWVVNPEHQHVCCIPDPD